MPTPTPASRRPSTGGKRTPVKPTPAKPKPYFKLLSEIEHTVENAPPTDIGTKPEQKAWLDENAKKQDVVQLPCGLQYRILERGPNDKKSPLLNTMCECHYRGTRLDGFEFDSSYARGVVAKFMPSKMIQGWTIAMQLMAEGDKYELFVPSELAYGDAGRKDAKRGQYIEPGDVLVFELHILKVNGPTKAKPVRPELPTDGSFVPALTFDGAKTGYVFTSRPAFGTGYYKDATQQQEAAAAVDVGDNAAAAAPSAAESSGKLEKPPSMGELTVEVPPSRQSSDELGSSSSSSSSIAAPMLFERESLIAPGGLHRPSTTTATQEGSSPSEAVLKEFSDFAAKKLEQKLEEQRTDLETAAMEAVNAVLSKLRLPTLKQALQDLGLPQTGDKAKMTQRLSERALGSSLSNRSNRSDRK